MQPGLYRTWGERLKCYKWFLKPIPRHGTFYYPFGFAEVYVSNQIVVTWERTILRTKEMLIGQIRTFDGTCCISGYSPIRGQFQLSHSLLTEPDLDLNWKRDCGRGLHAYVSMFDMLEARLPLDYFTKEGNVDTEKLRWEKTHKQLLDERDADYDVMRKLLQF